MSSRDPARRKIKATADARVWQRPRNLSSVPQPQHVYPTRNLLGTRTTPCYVSSAIIAGGRVGLIVDEDRGWIYCSRLPRLHVQSGRQCVWSSQYRASTELIAIWCVCSRIRVCVLVLTWFCFWLLVSSPSFLLRLLFSPSFSGVPIESIRLWWNRRLQLRSFLICSIIGWLGAKFFCIPN